MPVVFKKLQQSVGTPMWLLYPYKEQSCYYCSVWRAKPRINYIQGGGVKQNINMETHYFHSFHNDMFFSVSFFITFATTISKSSCVTSTLLSLRANIPDSVHTACSKKKKNEKNLWQYDYAQRKHTIFHFWRL